jgi:hypothetical protein
VSSRRKRLEHNPVPIGYSLMSRTNTRVAQAVPGLKTAVTVEYKHGRGSAIFGELGRQREILCWDYRDPIQRGSEGGNVIKELTGSGDFSALGVGQGAVSNCQELLKRLPGTRLKIGILLLAGGVGLRSRQG